MSELINVNDNRATIRWKLLASASALALTSYVSSMGAAKAEDTDRPLIWIELGGQMENVQGQGESFPIGFVAKNPNSPVLGSVTPMQAQKPPLFGFGEEAKISFQPEDSDWIFSAGVRYGRSSGFRRIQHQTVNTWYLFYTHGHPRGTSVNHTNPHATANFSDTKAGRQESHAILDFQAGKDVGLGIFGSEVSSTLGVGVRIAQFTSKSSLNVRARPDLQFYDISVPSYYGRVHLPYFHTYYITGQAARSFKGVGPSLSWTGSAPFAGNEQDGELAVDWGVNAALLFGKQKARVRQHLSAHYASRFNQVAGHYYSPVYSRPGGHDNSRSVTVPNVGGSIGLSWRSGGFKVSMSYRTDFFFGAMDAGIDTVKKSNLTFNGPYASISIGIGD